MRWYLLLQAVKRDDIWWGNQWIWWYTIGLWHCTVSSSIQTHRKQERGDTHRRGWLIPSACAIFALTNAMVFLQRSISADFHSFSLTYRNPSFCTVPSIPMSSLSASKTIKSSNAAYKYDHMTRTGLDYVSGMVRRRRLHRCVCVENVRNDKRVAHLRINCWHRIYSESQSHPN